MDHGEHERPRPDPFRVPSSCDEALLREALQKLQSAAVTIDLIINDELAGHGEPGTLDRLCAAKGQVARAIDGAIMHLSIPDPKGR